MDAALHRIPLPAGALLFAEGDLGASAYLIDSGEIEVFVLRDGGEILLARRGPGEIVGEMAILDNGPRSASARAVAACELILITAEQIAHRIADTDPILRMCLGVVIARYRQTVALVDLAYRPRVSQPEPARALDEFQAAMGTLSLESELRGALERGEFELYFQPIVRLPSRRLAGFEALLRWRHPTRGLVPPSAFIPIAEASGIVGAITDWCLAQVGRVFPILMTAALANVGSVEPLFLSVNVSGHDLGRASFLKSVEALLALGVDPAGVKLEVTEGVLMKDPGMAVATLEACRRLGLGIALDDFGTGYSSLSHLSTLPITTLKIDRSFVVSMTEAAASRKIIAMILRLAEELDIPVVAEGIEEVEQERILADLGCAYGQGYLFGKPQTLDGTIALIGAWQPYGPWRAAAGPGRATIRA